MRYNPWALHWNLPAKVLKPQKKKERHNSAKRREWYYQIQSPINIHITDLRGYKLLTHKHMAEEHSPELLTGILMPEEDAEENIL
jgi:hypothetical protein